MEEYNLGRFVEAQDHLTIYGPSVFDQAMKEIADGGLKIHCWIRYLYPQMKGLGTSRVTNFYGINGRDEAKAYLNHPLLRKRLIDICELLLNNERTVYEIFEQDAMRIRSCVLLFASVSDIPVFHQLKAKYQW